MKLRQFNDAGIERFRSELKKCRENPFSEIDRQLLENDALTDKIPGNVGVADQLFRTKGDAGEYLHSLFDSAALTHDNIMSNKGLWSWLSLFFFDSVCPLNSQGRRRVNAEYYYIYNPEPRRGYSHLLFVSWRVLDMTKQHHRLITTTRIDLLDKVTATIMSRLYFTRIPCIFEVLDHLYWNDTTQKARKNITDSEVRKGDLATRFPRVIRQLEKTYDLQSLNAKELIELLGDEFDFSSR